MQLTVGRIREAIKGLPDTAEVNILIDSEVKVKIGIYWDGYWEHAEDFLESAKEAIPDHAKATLTIKV